MKVKLGLLILLAFLLCGCSANVNISIKDSTISERISIVETPYGEITLSDISQQYRKYIPAFNDIALVDTMPDEEEDGIEYYKASSNETNGSYNAIYQYDYDFLEYKNATSLNNTFRSPTVEYDENSKRIVIKTDANELLLFSNYPQLDEVRVNISTNYKVLENNADSINGNVYTWVFRKGITKSINFILEDKDGKSINTGDKKGREDEEDDNKVINTGDDKKEEQEQQDKNMRDKIQEEGKKHPMVVVLVAVGFFLLVIFVSFNVKKV